MEKYIAAFDQGTTSSRCILFDRKGNIYASKQQEFPQYFPRSGWVEHNPNEIWSSQYGVFMELLAETGIDGSSIDSIGITNQRETTIVWDRETGIPVYPAIVWQCRRTSERISELKKKGLYGLIKEKTGLVLDPYFSATKIEWILNNVKGAREKAENGQLLFGTVDTWLMYKMTRGRVFATDYTNASRTMLYNIRELCWDKELLDLFKIPIEMMPEVKDSSGIFGTTSRDLFGYEIPIAGVAGDQQAALFGQCCFEEGDAKNTYGTGCFLLMNTGKEPVESRNGLITTIAAGINGSVDYALEGSVFIAGALIQWLRDEMGLLRNAEESEKMAESVSGSNGVYIVPAFTGLGAPYWDPDARGTVFGLSRGTKKEHFVRAALESLAYQTMDVLHAMECDSGIKMKNLKVDGGASENRFLLKFQADILNAVVEKPWITETTALGVSYLAGLATGYFKDKETIKKDRRLKEQIEPDMEMSIRNKLTAGWKDAVMRTKSQNERGEV